MAIVIIFVYTTKHYACSSIKSLRLRPAPSNKELTLRATSDDHQDVSKRQYSNCAISATVSTLLAQQITTSAK
jgi:hypothetical protein